MENTTPSSIGWASDYGATKRRSARIDENKWESLKPELCSLYKDHKLTEVLEEMKTKYGFEPSKRQLNYRLEKWGVRKYGVSERRASSPGFTHDEELYTPLAETSFDMEEYGSNSFLNIPGHRHLRTTPSNRRAMSISSEAGASFVYEDSPPAKGIQQVPNGDYQLGPEETTKKLVADFLHAMSDDRNAYQLNKRLYEAVLGAPEASIAAKKSIITSIARVAVQPEDAKWARGILLKHQAILSNVSQGQSFLFTMLDITLQEQEDAWPKGAIEGRIYSAVEQVLVHETKLQTLPPTRSTIDIMMRHSLHQGFKSYAKMRGIDQVEEFSNRLLSQYVSTQPISTLLRCDNRTILSKCVHWCANQLQLNISVPSEVASINCGPDQNHWRDNVQLYCTLWRCMLQNVQNDTPPSWYTSCEHELGISPSELLVNVCWMVGGEASELASPASILQRSRTAAVSMIQTQSRTQLWAAFFEKFRWLNTIEEHDTNKDFGDLIIKHARQFISATFNLSLPFRGEDLGHDFEGFDIGGMEVDCESTQP